MAISEAARADLYTGLRDAIGRDRAETLMSAIPLHDLDEVATKADLAVLKAEFVSEIADLRTELKGEMAALRHELSGDMTTLRDELKGDTEALRHHLTGNMTALGSRLDADIVGLRVDISDLRADMVTHIGSLRRTVTGWMITILVTMVAALVAVAIVP